MVKLFGCRMEPNITRLLLQRKIKRLPLKAKLVLFATMVLSVSFYGSVLYSIFWKNHLQDVNFLELNKCPACHGKSFCHKFFNGDVVLDGWSKVRILDFVNVKNVHFGILKVANRNAKVVVMKKLGNNAELKKVDKQICKQANEPAGCDVSVAISKTKAARQNNLSPGTLKSSSDLVTCPSLRMLRKLQTMYKEKKVEDEFTDEEKMNLITTIMTNSEPLIMQLFPRAEGWPFPRYLGACGRFIVEEYAGKPLADYYDAPWEERVDLAYQIFMIAEMFTENKEGYALYWTDVGYHNMAVNSDGKIIIVDAENIIVVDKAKIRREKAPGWNIPYYSKFEACGKYGTCLSFSETELCAKYTVDLNYYSVCRNLLSSYGSDEGMPDGLLHDLPKDIEDAYGVTKLLNECAKPSQPSERLKVREKIKEVLGELRERL